MAKDPTNDGRPGYKIGDDWLAPAKAMRKIPDKDVLPIEPRRHGNGDVTLYLRVLATHGRSELAQGAMPPAATMAPPPRAPPAPAQAPPPAIPQPVKDMFTSHDARLKNLETTVGAVKNTVDHLGPTIQAAIGEGFKTAFPHPPGRAAPAPPVFTTPAPDSGPAYAAGWARAQTFIDGPSGWTRAQTSSPSARPPPRIIVRNSGRTEGRTEG